MATKKKSNAKPLPKKKRANAPLLAGTPSVRRSKARGKATRAPASADALNPAFAMLEFMARVTAAYAELSSRLLQMSVSDGFLARAGTVCAADTK
jgi:predicted hotdog family 3-hydroxylacyl-ACP dehydratase